MSAVEFEGHCGAVRVFINGNAQVKRIEIDDEVKAREALFGHRISLLTSVQSEDGVEDTAICKATNDALNQVRLRHCPLYWLFVEYHYLQLKETLQKTRNLELKGVAKELQDLAHASSI